MPDSREGRRPANRLRRGPEERDRAADERDRVAAEQDRVAGALLGATGGSDATVSKLMERVSEMRRRAAADRGRAAADRASAAGDRREAARDRVAGELRLDETRAGLVVAPTDVLLQALTERDLELGFHVGAVVELACGTAVELGASEEEVEATRRTAFLHDVGKVAIPDEVLNKRGALDASEWSG